MSIYAFAMRRWGDLPFKRGALTVSSLRAYYPNEALRLADFGQGCNDRGLYKLSKSPNNRVDARRPRGGTSTQGPPDWVLWGYHGDIMAIIWATYDQSRVNLGSI